MSAKRGAPAPAVVGSHFVKQYYGEILSKKPVELHRFYTDESTFCHASGTKEEEPVSGLADIKAKIEHLGLGGATVDLGCGSVDAQPSEGSGVLLMVTGSITIADMDPRQFCQTFFLARQHQDNDRHNYFVRNDIFRFLDVLPEVVQAALKARNEVEGSTTRAVPVVASEGEKEEAVAVEGMGGVVQETSPAGESVVVSTPQVTAIPASPVGTVAVPDVAPSPMAMGAAPPSESQVAAATTGSAAVAPAVASDLDNGSGGKGSPAKVVATVAPAAVSPSPAPAALTPESVAAAGPAPPASPVPPAASAAPASPPAPLTYAFLAKSWATVAAVGGDVAAPSLSAAGGGPPAAASTVTGAGAVAGSSGNGAVAAPASNGGWGAPDAASVGGAGLSIEQPLPQQQQQQQQAGVGGGQGSSRPSSAPGKGQKESQYIPHHASPAVAASAAAAREAAAAGNGEILPATSLFVRKVDMTIDKEEMIAHFSVYGDVTGISMNPTRGYAFIDYRTNECVQVALSTKEHYVNRKLLVVEERHSPMLGRNARGEHGGGRGGRNGGRGRGSGGRDGRDGERRGARGGMGRGDRPEGPGLKEGGYKTRGRAEPA